MAKIIKLEDHSLIANIYEQNEVDFTIKELLYISSVLEVCFERVTDKALSIFHTNKRDLTLHQLAMIVTLNFDTDNLKQSLLGFSFERMVYNAIIYNQDNIKEVLNSFLIKLQGGFFKNINNANNYYYDFNNGSNEIDVIIWGTEKGNWVNSYDHNFTLLQIQPNDQIIIDNIAYNMKEKLKELFVQGDKSMKRFWKSDIFIKQRKSNLWFGVDIKKNLEDINLSEPNSPQIGIALSSKKFVMDKILWDKKQFNDNLNFIFNFARNTTLADEFVNCFNKLLSFFKHIKKTSPCEFNFITFPDWRDWSSFLFQYREEKVVTLINEIDRRLVVHGFPTPTRGITENSDHLFVYNNNDFTNSLEEGRKIIMLNDFTRTNIITEPVIEMSAFI